MANLHKQLANVASNPSASFKVVLAFRVVSFELLFNGVYGSGVQNPEKYINIYFFIKVPQLEKH